MRTDPRKACKNEQERLLWALIHDGIAHPLMALTFYAWAPAIWFHDWTSHRAWPRVDPGPVSYLAPGGRRLQTTWKELAFAYSKQLREMGIPHVTRSTPTDGVFWYDVEEMELK